MDIFFARITLCVHLLFLIFVSTGALFVYKWKWVLWLHIPAVLWGSCAIIFGWVCPLTPLEKWFLNQAQYPAYDGSFIEYYLIEIIYPSGLTRSLQIQMGIGAILLNVIIYSYILWTRHTKSTLD